MTRPQGPSPQEIAKILSEWFLTRRDRYGIQQDDGRYNAIPKKLTNAIITSHCKGDITVAVYTTDENGNSAISILDIDDKGPEAQALALFALAWLKSWGITAFLEMSGRKGFHIWIFYKCLVPAVKAQRLLRCLMYDYEQKFGGLPSALQGNKIEINPKQPRSTTFDEPGNMVKLPFGKHRVTETWTAFIDMAAAPKAEVFNDWGMNALKQTPRVTEVDLDAILEEFPNVPTGAPAPTQSGSTSRRYEDKPEFKDAQSRVVVEACSFLRHCRDAAVNLDRNHWWSMICIFSVFGDAGEAIIYEWSKSHPKYSEKETATYIENAHKAAATKGMKPHTCRYIEKDLGFPCPDSCEAHLHGSSSPAGLASRLASIELAQDASDSVTVQKKGKTTVITVNPVRLAREILNDITIVTTRDNGEMFHYCEGLYRPYAETIIRTEVCDRLMELSTIQRGKEVVDYIRHSTYIEREEMNGNADIVNLINGVLDMRSLTLLPHSPEYISTIRLPLTFDPTATCPVVDKFLGEILAPNDVALVEEIFGYCLENSYYIQKAFLFLGEGANGKSTLMDLLKQFLGSKNVSAEELQPLNQDRFSPHALYGKMANLVDDLSSVPVKSTAIFKSLVGGSAVRAEAKYANSYMFQNRAKLLFCSNKPPQVYGEDSSAFWRRWVIINFPHKFEEGLTTTDLRLIEKLTVDSEMSGLLNQALLGLTRTRTQCKFSYFKTQEETTELYSRSSNPVYAFVEERCSVSSDGWIGRDELYDAFQAFATEMNVPIMPRDAFVRRIQNLPNAGGVHKDRRMFLGARQYGLSGISLANNDDEITSSATQESTEEKIDF